MVSCDTIRHGLRERTVSHRRPSRGFTLIEMMIVVVILANLAAIVLTEAVVSVEDAKHAAALRTLRELRTRIEIEMFQGTFPDTHAEMEVYKTTIPVNPLTGINSVKGSFALVPDDSHLTPGGGGWIYYGRTSTLRLDSDGYLEY